MRRLVLISICISLLGALAPAPLGAAWVTLQPQRTATIQSPSDSRDTRVLVYFEVPERLGQEGIEVEYARLVFTAGVRDAPLGQVEIFPLTTAWAESEVVRWNRGWTEDGGDFSLERPGVHQPVRAADGVREHRSDVTYIVKAWVDGVIANYGLILMPSASELETSEDIGFTIDTRGIRLVIGYERE